MEQRVSLVTLGVSDYARSKAFYEALGWSVALDIEETAFFQANGSILVLWARDKLAQDTGISDDVPAVRSQGYRIASPEEAARLIAALEPRDRGLWATAMYAGLRRGELQALDWSSVDLAAGV